MASDARLGATVDALLERRLLVHRESDWYPDPEDETMECSWSYWEATALGRLALACHHAATPCLHAVLS